MWYLRITINVAAASFLLTACGGNGDTPSAPDPTRPVDIVYGDCSSFRKYSRDYVPDMLAIAQDAARHKRKLYAGCFDGAPLRTLYWKPKINFGDLPKELRGDDSLAERFNIARALGLRDQFVAMLNRRQKARGSGQLEALELAASTHGVGRVWMFTDAIVNQIDGIKLAIANGSEIQQTARRWIPRLRPGLNGVPVTFVGVGRGTSSTVTVRNAEELFRLTVRGAGGTFTWSQTLPAIK